MDEEKLISKKEVLEKMGISYGQLYRWKRKGLIPESWFVRRATFTGQETFFPQEKILERIKRIKTLKEDHPLDDLAELIAQQVGKGLAVATSILKQMGWLDEDLLEICNLKEDRGEALSLKEALCLGALRRLKGVARGEEIELAKSTLQKALGKNGIEVVRENALFLYLLRKRLSGAGISAEISLAVVAKEGAVFDPEIEIVQTVDLGTVLERIKLDLVKGEK